MKLFALLILLLFIATVDGQRGQKWKKGKRTKTPKTVIIQKSGKPCPEGRSRITSKWGCRVAMDLADPHSKGNQEGFTFRATVNDADWPKGCVQCTGSTKKCPPGTYFNEHSTGSDAIRGSLYCTNEAIEENRILFVGDSDIDFWKTSTLTDFAGAYNIGVGGYTCQDVLDEISDILSELKPSKIVLVCGENDLAEGIDVDTTYERIKEITRLTKLAGVQVIYLGTKHEPGTKELWESYWQYDKKVKDRAINLAKKNSPPPIVVIDTNPAFHAMGNSKSLYQRDKLHLSKKAYYYWSLWTQKALNDDTDCVVWQNGACVPSCSDDSSYRYEGDNSKDCANWVAAAPVTRCALQWNEEFVWDNCRSTCFNCAAECEDSGDLRLNGKKKKSCSWARKRPGGRCSLTSKDGTAIADECPISCGTCS